jgi:hypothetical protein
MSWRTSSAPAIAGRALVGAARLLVAGQAMNVAVRRLLARARAALRVAKRAGRARVDAREERLELLVDGGVHLDSAADAALEQTEHEEMREHAHGETARETERDAR